MSTLQIKGRLIAGVPATTIRDALRRSRHCQVFTNRLFVEECKVSKDKGRQIVSALLADGFLEVAERPKWARRERAQYYRTTAAGFKLSNASGLARMPRSKGKTMLTDFLTRVNEVNKNPEYVYTVDTVIVSGSYARGEDTLGDLDIFYGLAPRFSTTDLATAHEKRIEAAYAKGRRFSNIVEELCWPEQEVRLRLKARTRGLSLHSLDEFFKMEKDKDFAYKVLIGDADKIAIRLSSGA